MSQVKPATGHDARGLPTRIRHAIWRHGKVLRQRILPRPVAQHVFVAGMQRSGTNPLMDAFTPAKTLWVLRDWRDSVNSAIKSFGNFVPQWKRLAHGDSSDWRGRGMADAPRELLAGLDPPLAR